MTTRHTTPKILVGDRYYTVQVWVVSVTDGDTVRVIFDGDTEPVKVRLGGLDAPESDQEFGLEATALLESLALGRTLTLDVVCTGRNLDCAAGDACTCTDIYGRLVGVLHDGNWKDSINKQLIEAGLAYNWPRYGRVYGGHNAERRAKSERVGIWQRHGGEVRPWSHRHGGTLNPLEYTKAKKEEAKAKRSQENAEQLLDEVERLRQMLEDAGIED